MMMLMTWFRPVEIAVRCNVRKRTIYIDEEVDRMMRVAAAEDDKYFGDYAEESFRLFLDKRKREKRDKK
jgi:hypothetical protein